MCRTTANPRLHHLKSYLQDTKRADAAARAVNTQRSTLLKSTPDLSVASRQDLRDDLVLLSDAANSIDRYKTWLRILIWRRSSRHLSLIFLTQFLP